MVVPALKFKAMEYEEKENESRSLAEPEVVFGVDKRSKAANIARRKNIRRNTESDIQMELEECLRIYRDGGPDTRSELIPRMEQWMRSHSAPEAIQKRIQHSLTAVGERKGYTEEKADKELRRVFTWLK